MNTLDRIALIKELTNKYKDEFIMWRRHFHENPELSFEEFETSDFIAEKLVEMGYEVKEKIGGTGVVGILDTKKSGPIIAFRAEMDALPLVESTDLSFESRKPGIMHGCGHDVHMATLLGTAKIFSLNKDKLKGCIKIIFQPGEESNGGAKCIINDGVLKDPNVESIFALHINPDLNVGSIGIKDGYLSATDDEITIRVWGISSHSSSPEKGVNAIMIAANILTMIQSIQTNSISPYDIATFSICKIKGGEAINIIPDYVEMSGMVRCIDKNDKYIFREKIEHIAKNVAKSMGGKAQIEVMEGFPAVNNNCDLTNEVISAAKEVLTKPEDVIIMKRPHLGSEDFAHYQEEIPGVIFVLGVGVEGEDRGGLHTITLNPHEDAIENGVKVFTNIGMIICGK